MSFEIKTLNDVFKFTLPLYDYLSQNGHSQDAETLATLVDSCYPQNAQTIEAHRKAFSQIRESAKDLPSQYLFALDDALTILSM
jgi:hypothetical protein